MDLDFIPGTARPQPEHQEERMSRRALGAKALKFGAAACGLAGAAFGARRVWQNILISEHRGLLWRPSYPERVARDFSLPDGSSATLSMARDDYLQLLDRGRPFSQSRVQDFVAQEQVHHVARKLWDISKHDRLQYVKTVMDFLGENVKYQSDGNRQFTKFPLETLLEGGGDCEDLTVLAAAFFAWANVRTGVAYSKEHAAVAVSFDEREEQASFPEIVKVAELFDHSRNVDAKTYFDRAHIHPRSVLVIPAGTTYAQGLLMYGEKIRSNQYYQERPRQTVILGATGEELEFSSGRSDYLSPQERETLPMETAIELSAKRRREAIARGDEPARISFKIQSDGTEHSDPTNLKYFYLEATAANKWQMFDGLPISYDLFPLKPDQYGTAE